MLITRETDYALRILRALSCGEQKSIPLICEEEQVPKQFAYKILKKLSSAGLVQIARGAAGGCRLSADPRQVTLYDLMAATGEDRLVNACTDGSFQCARSQCIPGGCTVHRSLAEAQQRMDDLLRSYTLQKLLED